MNNKHDSTDSYRILIHNKILKIAPFTAISAAFTFTIARIFGWFETVDTVALIIFDIICFAYCIPAYLIKKAGILKDGKVCENYIYRTNIILCLLIILQWNLITYIFPSQSFWGFAPMFVILTAFMFQSKVVLFEIFGLSFSIGISWIILGEKLLPVNDSDFIENLILRIVALLISFAVIYFITYFAEKFTKIVKQNDKDLKEKNDTLEKMGRDILDYSAEIIEERDITSGTHVKRIKDYTRILGAQVMLSNPEYGLTNERIEQIALASILHDIGKIAIPDSILLKPDKLTAEEYEVIKTHTTLGARMIDKLPDSVDKDYKLLCKEICLFHHERYTGKGYPSGIKGDDIPISAQIVSVIDCFDALSNDRPYKKAFPKETAIKMIINGECGEFSDKMKKCILECADKLISLEVE